VVRPRIEGRRRAIGGKQASDVMVGSEATQPLPASGCRRARRAAWPSVAVDAKSFTDSEPDRRSMSRPGAAGFFPPRPPASVTLVRSPPEKKMLGLDQAQGAEARRSCTQRMPPCRNWEGSDWAPAKTVNLGKCVKLAPDWSSTVGQHDGHLMSRSPTRCRADAPFPCAALSAAPRPIRLKLRTLGGTARC